MDLEYKTKTEVEQAMKEFGLDFFPQYASRIKGEWIDDQTYSFWFEGTTVKFHYEWEKGHIQWIPWL